MRDERLVREARVGAAKLVGDGGVAHGRPAHVHLVDDGVGPRVTRSHRVVVTPVERLVDHQRRGDPRGGVGAVPGDPRARGVVDGAVERPRAGIEQELGRVAPQVALEVDGPVRAEPVPLAGANARHVAAERPAVARAQLDALLSTEPVEQADLDDVGEQGGHGEVTALLGERGAEGRGPPVAAGDVTGPRRRGACGARGRSRAPAGACRRRGRSSPSGATHPAPCPCRRRSTR